MTVLGKMRFLRFYSTFRVGVYAFFFGLLMSLVVFSAIALDLPLVAKIGFGFVVAAVVVGILSVYTSLGILLFGMMKKCRQSRF